ncbi:MAG: hypothetical protein BMS9Abin02_0434 [Anaerolineae bacterium]|nr:MAG: hypothetical protein BMS9Abin02_0434 [Anaerolineae bacterium]
MDYYLIVAYLMVVSGMLDPLLVGLLLAGKTIFQNVTLHSFNLVDGKSQPALFLGYRNSVFKK